MLIEIRDRYRLLVHHNVSEAVDSLLRDKMPLAEVREFANGEVKRTPVRLTKRDGVMGDSGETGDQPQRGAPPGA